jgi:hypothetical protein
MERDSDIVILELELRRKIREIEETKSEKEKLEFAVRGQITELKYKVTERDNDIVTLELEMRRKIRETEEKNSEKKKLESALREQANKNDNKILGWVFKFWCMVSENHILQHKWIKYKINGVLLKIKQIIWVYSMP